MKFEPHPYQRQAMRWIHDKGRCCLFLGMGMGKSAIVLSAFEEARSWLGASRLLVVAPKRVAESTWGDEAAKWDHLRHLSVALCLGEPRKRQAAINADADVTVIARDSIQWLVDEMQGQPWPWDMIAVDELTSFKNSKSKRTKAMIKASKRADMVVGLTGTPAPNGLVDLWAQMAVVDLGMSLGTRESVFHARYFTEVRWNNVVIKRPLRKGAEEEIRSLLADRCLSMSAADYLSMPPLIERDLWVTLPKHAAAAYKGMERDGVLEFAAESAATAASAAALANKLSQIANGFVYDEDHLAQDLHDAKMGALCELWEAAQAEGSGLLVFYQYDRDADRAMEALSQAGAKALRYDGNESLKAWNDRECDALLCHPASTAFGLNMQQGGWCIAWLGTGWNLELYQQANARLHRQGQTRPVIATRILAKDTIDWRIAAAIKSKDGVQAALMDALKGLVRDYGA